MSELFTISYPVLGDCERALVERLRSAHDPLCGVVAAHFTLVFGCSSVVESEYVRHVAAVAARTAAIEFCCRRAILGSDPEDEVGYVFLVPDEGRDALVRLHAELHTGPLVAQLDSERTFVPHITIGALADGNAARRLCDELGSERLCLAGSLRALTVGALMAGRFEERAVHLLGG